ncbi:hypothetical protein DB347_25360 [Opitutaceae bacterium EW11]|nr:hypothetical protein DB347_25360 [Opitutaceae bacterium EW11]
MHRIVANDFDLTTTGESDRANPQAFADGWSRNGQRSRDIGKAPSLQNDIFGEQQSSARAIHQGKVRMVWAPLQCRTFNDEPRLQRARLVRQHGA